MLANIITWMSNTIGSYGWAVVLCVLISQLLLIPLQIFASKNSAAKAACAPEISKIRKKYNANQLGVSMDDPDNLDPEVKKMSHDERDEAMANEIAATYKAHNYHMWTGWIPTVANLVLIVLMWQGIRSAAPEGFYRMGIGDVSGNAMQILLFVSTPIISLISSAVSLFKTARDNRGKPTFKSSVLAGCFAAVLSIGLSAWITFSVSAAIALALLTLQLWSMGFSAILRIATKGANTAVELS